MIIAIANSEILIDKYITVFEEKYHNMIYSSLKNKMILPEFYIYLKDDSACNYAVVLQDLSIEINNANYKEHFLQLIKNDLYEKGIKI